MERGVTAFTGALRWYYGDLTGNLRRTYRSLRGAYGELTENLQDSLFMYFDHWHTEPKLTIRYEGRTLESGSLDGEFEGKQRVIRGFAGKVQLGQ